MVDAREERRLPEVLRRLLQGNPERKRMTPTRVLIFGRGQLGSYYRAAFESNGCAVEMPEGDIRDEAFVSGAVSSVQPDLIVNVAAKTNIDWCEMNKQEA